MKIICVGMNYALHNEELHETAAPADPVLFMKPDTALQKEGWPFFVPEFSQQVEYETELVVRICRVGRYIPERFAHRYYQEVTVGLDFTARDVQRDLRAKGLPWELCKAFDNSAVVGSFVPLAELGKPVQDLRFEMQLNGEMRQQGHTAEMLHTVDRIIAYASRYFMLKTGDLIFTGTPAGVGRVAQEDLITASLEGRQLLTCRVK
jgi:2-keto-4-pentenoate hydratase/2-oxohepta-3-ene-1,7-dioic acid hydratase in catechol pathway